MKTTKKLLIIGSKPAGTYEIVKYAKENNIYTIVTDYHPKEKSKAKQLADESWMISVLEIDELENKCKENKINGILCGVDESYIPIVIELCERLKLPCYLNKTVWKKCQNKRTFKDECKRAEILVAEDYQINELEKIVYPVVVKPVDANSSKGVGFCNNKNELIKNYKIAIKKSKSSNVIIERQINGDECTFFYIFANGEASLVGDEKFYYQPNERRQSYCLLSSFNDVKNDFLEQTNPKIKQLFKNLGCKDGFGWVQIRREFDTKKIYVQEMGYRLGGPLNWLAFEKLNKANILEWMVDFALGKKHYKKDLPEDRCLPNGPYVSTYVLWVKKPGIVKKIEGIKYINELPLVSATLFCDEGYKFIEPSYAATITFITNNQHEICNMIENINNHISIIDTNGEEMLLKYINYNNALLNK